jgi:hypothetical protein
MGLLPSLGFAAGKPSSLAYPGEDHPVSCLWLGVSAARTLKEVLVAGEEHQEDHQRSFSNRVRD